MNVNDRDLGRSSRMMTRMIPMAIWLGMSGIALLALFQAMPAAAYLRAKNQSRSERGDRHDA
jgi:hypothetical protein